MIQELSVDGKDIIENKQRFSDRECCYLTLRRPLKERGKKRYMTSCSLREKSLV